MTGFSSLDHHRETSRKFNRAKRSLVRRSFETGFFYRLVDEHNVIKTLVMEDDKKDPLIVLMHGDLKVSTKELARVVKAKIVTPCAPETAFKHTGYMIGGTSPFGTRKQMRVWMEETILGLARIYINGGRRGYLVGMDPGDVVKILKPTMVKVGISS